MFDNDAERQERVEHNYQVAKRFFGLDVVQQELEFALLRPQNIYRLLKHQQRAAHVFVEPRPKD